MNKDELTVRALELGITVPEGATNAEITTLIKVAEHPLISEELAKTQEALKAVSATNNTLSVDLATAKTDIQTANETIDSLNELIKDESTAASEGIIYKSGGKTYQFGVATFRFKGVKYEASEAVEDKDLMADLIKAKFNFLKEI